MTTITKAIIGIILASTISFIPAAAAEISETNIIDSNSDVDSKISKIISEYVEKYPQYSFEINDIFNIISKTDNYSFSISFDPEGTYKMLEDNFEFLIESLDKDENDVEPQYVSNGLYTSDYTVPVVKQMKNYNCGIAAAIQALIGDGKLADIDANKGLAMQNKLETQIDNFYSEKYVNKQYANMVNYILNEYSSDAYECINVNRYNVNDIITNMKNSLKDGYCPVVLIDDTSYLNYYNNASYRHYITVSQINAITGKIVVVDPFNSSIIPSGSASFGGTHTITYDELLDSIELNHGWVIIHES